MYAAIDWKALPNQVPYIAETKLDECFYGDILAAGRAGWIPSINSDGATCEWADDAGDGEGFVTVVSSSGQKGILKRQLKSGFRARVAATDVPHVFAEEIGQRIFRRPTYHNFSISGAEAIAIAFSAFGPLAWIVTRLPNSGVHTGFEKGPQPICLSQIAMESLALCRR
jgi:hypothetical protein